MHAKGLSDDATESLGCDADSCPTQEGVDQRANAVTFSHVSTALVVVGGVVAAGGIVLFAVAPSEEVTVSAGLGYIGVSTAFH